MFGKKKEEPVQQQEHTEIIRTDSMENDRKNHFKITNPVEEVPVPKVEETIKQEEENIYTYYVNKYSHAFGASPMFTPAQAELQNLLFGILTELKELKEFAIKATPYQEDE